MTRSIRAMTTGICLLALAAPLAAHHSFTNFWNLDEMREIEGVVKAVKLVNPHCEIILEVTEANGQKFDYIIASQGTGTAILRGGWSYDTLPVGTKVTVRGSPPRRPDGKALIAGLIIREDGQEFSFGGIGGIPAG